DVTRGTTRRGRRLDALRGGRARAGGQRDDDRGVRPDAADRQPVPHRELRRQALDGRGDRLPRGRDAADAARPDGRRVARRRDPQPVGRPAHLVLRATARPRHQRVRATDRREGRAAPQREPAHRRKGGAAEPARPRRRADRDQRPRDRRPAHVRPRPAHGHLQRPRRRQEHADVFDREEHERGRLRARADRRARQGGQRLHREEPGRGRAEEVRRRRRHRRRGAAAARPRREGRLHRGRVFQGPRGERPADDGQPDPHVPGAAPGRPRRPRAARDEGIPAERVRAAARDPRTRWPHGEGFDHRVLHRAGGRRRLQRADPRRGEGHHRRPPVAEPPAGEPRPLPRDRRAPEHQPGAERRDGEGAAALGPACARADRGLPGHRRPREHRRLRAGRQRRVRPRGAVPRADRRVPPAGLAVAEHVRAVEEEARRTDGVDRGGREAAEGPSRGAERATAGWKGRL
ncbi:MAG: Flagellum-specific ATP synthase FliI, partial [uncultured Phycisphaerae bacterium]